MPNELRVRLFGTTRIEVDGEASPLRVPGSALALLAFLLLHRIAPMKRSTVAFQLWPDDPEAEALVRLRRNLFRLAAALPPPDGVPWIEADSRSIRWNPHAAVWVDAAEFVTLARDATTMEAAVALYGDDLLAELGDEWVRPLRDGLREQYVSALTALRERARQSGDLVTAESFAVKLLACDPWREDALRARMEIRAGLGDRGGALAIYREFAQRLSADMGVEPMEETRAAFEELAAAPEMRTHGLRDNLPVQPTTLVGRAPDVSAVCRLLRESEHRFVTLTGVGGVGKTRLAIEAARALANEHPDGAWLAALEDVRGSDQVLPTIALTLGIVQQAGSSLLDTTVRVLRGRRLVLVLDNCEHLIAEVAHVAGTIARSCPNVRIIATSRDVLRVSGETTYLVHPLRMPAAGVVPSDPLLYPAVELFWRRASDPCGTAVDTIPANLGTVAAIVRRLDGIPLAIELAAARARVLSLEQILQGLGEPFRLLAGGSRDVPPRQQSIRASMDWSYDLLSEDEKRLLECMSRFPVPATLENLDAIASLVDKSLLFAAGTSERRYGMLDTVREYLIFRNRERDALIAS